MTSSNDDCLECGTPGEIRDYRILFALGDLGFAALRVADPVPLGRQILRCAGLDPSDGYSLFAILPTGDFEDVRLDEPFDLRERGTERFVAFKTDRVYKLMVNDSQVAWGERTINGAALYVLANISEDEAVFLDVRGGNDRLIELGELIDLSSPGIERFITAPRPVTRFEIIVNARQRIVTDKLVTFEQVVLLAFPDSPPESNVVYSMTYRHSDSKPHAGELGSGGSVVVKEKGTIFNVTKTVQS